MGAESQASAPRRAHTSAQGWVIGNGFVDQREQLGTAGRAIGDIMGEGVYLMQPDHPHRRESVDSEPNQLEPFVFWVIAYLIRTSKQAKQCYRRFSCSNGSIAVSKGR